MIELSIFGGVVILGGIALWLVRKGGKDSANSDHNEKAIEDVEKANAARNDPSYLKLVRDKYKR